MKIELDDEAINKSKRKIDKTVLIAALELFANHGFLKERISEIKIEEVYESTGHVKPEIVIRNSEGPVKTTDSLRNLLSSYLDHLKAGDFAEPHAFLFPGYDGKKGQKQLQRHIKRYTEYRDFNALKKAVRKSIDDQLAESGIGAAERVNQIAATVGISHRSAEQSVRPPVSTGQKRSRKEKDEKTESKYDKFLKFLKQYDEIAVLPGILVLDELAVREFINEAFNLLLTLAPENQVSPKQLHIKNSFVCDLLHRVQAIENELIEEEKALDNPEGATSYCGLAKMIMEESQMIVVESDNNIIAGQLYPQRKNGLNVKKDAEPEVTEAMIDANIDRLFADIRRVQELVPNKKRQAWIAYEAHKRKTITKYGATPTASKGRKNEPVVTIPRDTEANIKEDKIAYIRNRALQDAQDNLLVTLENARELIKYTGLYAHEVPYLRIKDVVKSEHRQLSLEANIDPQWIVDEIQPIPDRYPRGCNKKAVHLTHEAKAVILQQIEFLKDNGPQHLLSERHLFPLSFKTQYVKRVNETERIRRGQRPKPSKPVKIKPEESNRMRFSRLLKQIDALGQRFDHHLEYEHLREYGIRVYCSKLRDEGQTFEEIIRNVCVFARYETEKDAERIWEEINKYNPDEYEKIYRFAVKLGDALTALLSKSSAGDLIDIKRSNFVSAIDLLSNRHKKAFHQKYKVALNYNIQTP